MKISETTDNVKAFTEFACMVCMAEKSTGNPKYNGCAMRKMGEYCPWMCEVIKNIWKIKTKTKRIFFQIGRKFLLFKNYLSQRKKKYRDTQI